MVERLLTQELFGPNTDKGVVCSETDRRDVLLRVMIIVLFINQSETVPKVRPYVTDTQSIPVSGH